MSRLLMGTSVLVGAMATVSVPALAQDTTEVVTVTGYRASLADSTNSKRAAVNFSDSVFAEDIGKFPDTNIAEAFNRIPGITISRENDGTGMRVAIRGLDTNHVKITLNGAVVQTASSGQTGAQGANREVDLNIFPIELFTQLTVSKTATPDQLEGGAAGLIAMRSARPFDNPGTHLSYNVQGTDFARNGNIGERGTLLGSWTEGSFGVLVGLSGQVNRFTVKAYEGTGNAITTPNLNNVMYYGTQANPAPTQTCATTTINLPGLVGKTTSGNTCNITGGNTDWNLPSIFPNTGVPASYVGKTVTSDLLLALNPGLTMDQISSGMVPRTGGPAMETGNRKRYNGIVSLEYRPTDDLHFYLDGILGVIENNMDRSRVFFIARSGAAIPMNMKVDANNVVTQADFANAALQEENRPYREKSDYISLNPGVDWQISELAHVDAQVNYSRAHFFRDSPTYLWSTVSGILHYKNNAGILDYTMDLPNSGGTNNPANWGYGNGADLRLQQERRYEYTKGAHANASYGGDEFKVRIGAAYDEQFRDIRGYDNGLGWHDYACGYGLKVGSVPTIIPSPNLPTSSCTIAVTPMPTYAGYGTGFTAGWGPLTAAGPALPNASIAQYGRPSPFGFARWDYAALDKATNYQYFATHPNAGAAVNMQEPGRTSFSTGTTTGISADIIDEKTMGFYGAISGTLHRGDQKVRYDIGARWVRTLQSMTGYNTVTDPRNVTLLDGGKYPNAVVPTTMKGSYSAFLPSANVVWEVLEDFQLRAAVSRTMTRPSPASMIPTLGGGGSDGLSWTLGNPQLKPYYSTNIDFGAELYTGGEGMIGVGWFKKMVTGFPNNVTVTQPFPYLAQFGRPLSSFTGVIHDSLKAAAINNGCYNAALDTADCLNVSVTQQANAQGLETIKGFEVTWVQPLDFLLEPIGLKGFGWQANANFVSTKTTPNSAAPSVVLGVSPTQYNLVGYYDNEGITVRMTYAFTKGTLTGSNVYGLIANLAAIQNEYSNDFATVDLSSSVKLSKFFGDLPTDPDLTFDVQNLFHAKNSGSYKMYPNLINQIYNPGSLFMLGIRGSI